MTRGSPRIAALDGLRGVAVSVVLASHALRWMHGGFLGVDVFFVLSGYLITSLLIAERDRTGRVDFTAFYRRRVARLAPAYLLMLVIATPLLAGPLHGTVLIPLWQAIGATAVYSANWVGMANIDALGPLMHTWSLSVEEQFYLLWPVAFVLLHRGGRSLPRTLAAGASAVAVARAVGWMLHPGPWAYVATFTHSDGLLAGCLVAVLLARRPAGTPARPLPGALVASAVSALGVLGAVLWVDDAATYLFGLTLAVAATGVLVWHLATGLTPGGPAQGRLDRALCWAPLVFTGRISYGLYLYHLPIFQLVQRWHLGFARTLALETGLTGAVAVTSWFALERPVQRWAARRAAAALSRSEAAAPSRIDRSQLTFQRGI
jgi:peptidoglycan/LPS O-acetylase OafA/YrhL